MAEPARGDHRLRVPRDPERVPQRAARDGRRLEPSHYENPKYDAAAKTFVAAPDLATQRKYAKQIEGILLSDTPIVFAYFYNYVAAGTSKVKSYQPEGLGAIELRGVSLG